MERPTLTEDVIRMYIMSSRAVIGKEYDCVFDLRKITFAKLKNDDVKNSIFQPSKRIIINNSIRKECWRNNHVQ